DVVFRPAVTFEDAADLVAEVAFDLQNEPANSLLFVVGAVGQDLLGKRIHRARGFPTANGTQDRDAREQAPLGDGQPIRRFRRNGLPWMMNLSDNDKQLIARSGVRICWQRPDAITSANLKASNIEAGKQHGIADVGRRKEEERIGVEEALV